MLEDLLYDPQRVAAVHAHFREITAAAGAASEKVSECEQEHYLAGRNLERARDVATSAQGQLDELQAKIEQLGLRSTTAWQEAREAWVAEQCTKGQK